MRSSSTSEPRNPTHKSILWTLPFRPRKGLIKGRGQRKKARSREDKEKQNPFSEGLAISEPVFEFVHPETNQKVEFFGGGYLFAEEGKLPYRGKEVLYLLGMAGIEASCCGTGGCAFIKVPGYIHAWKKRRNEVGLPVSEVERIEVHGERKEIQNLLQERHPGFSQVEFL